jgi:hypothetical protein
MTEAEWLTCTSVIRILDFHEGKASDRKMQLLGVGFCRRIWHLLTDERCHRTILGIERLADGMAERDELRTAMEDLYRDPPENCIVNALWGNTVERLCSGGGEFVRYPATALAVSLFAVATVADANTNSGDDSARERAETAEEAAHVGLVRDVFGNPFRPVTFDTSWLTSTVTTLASQIYDSRDFTAMPILADALQDAGCNSDDILNHCRQPGEHVRGCWVVDLILGKE